MIASRSLPTKQFPEPGRDSTAISGSGSHVHFTHERTKSSTRPSRGARCAWRGHKRSGKAPIVIQVPQVVEQQCRKARPCGSHRAERWDQTEVERQIASRQDQPAVAQLAPPPVCAQVRVVDRSHSPDCLCKCKRKRKYACPYDGYSGFTFSETFTIRMELIGEIS